MMTKRILPLFALVFFIFSSCGSDSENADINKEWTLIDLNYTGITSFEGDSITFKGQMVGGEALMQFSEEPNTILSKGMYEIQLEANDDELLRLSRQELTFEQFGTWTRDGNTISTSTEGSFDTDLIISYLSKDRLDLDFDFSVVVEFMGVPVMSDVKGTYFLASSDYIGGWKDQIKGGWILSDAEMTQYEGSFSQIDGFVDKLSVGTYSNGNAPLNFGDDGDFSASGSFSLDVDVTEFEDFGTITESTSKQSNSFLEDGTYVIDGRTLTITENGGGVRTFNIVDATDEQLIVIEFLDSEEMGPFDLITNRAQIKYTFDRQIYMPVAGANIIGEWTISDFNSELSVEVFNGGSLVSQSSGVADFISSTGKIIISDSPNTITSSGSYKIKVTQTESGIETESEQTESLFSATNWIKSDNEIQVFGTDFTNGSTTMSIEKLNQTEMILTETLDETIETGGFSFKTTGFRTFTFIR